MIEKIKDFEDTINSYTTDQEHNEWVRKFETLLSRIVLEVNPLEEQIMDLMSRKEIIMDEIVIQREELVKNCVHPPGHVEYLDRDMAECKFCGFRFKNVDKNVN